MEQMKCFFTQHNGHIENKERPHVLSIHEARLDHKIPIEEVYIEGYEIHTDGLYKSGKFGREVVYTSRDLVVKLDN